MSRALRLFAYSAGVRGRGVSAGQGYSQTGCIGCRSDEGGAHSAQEGFAGVRCGVALGQDLLSCIVGLGVHGNCWCLRTWGICWTL
jgi:hypothetical protein